MPVNPRLPVGERLRRAGVAAWSIIGLLILAAIGFWLLLKIRIIFPPLVLALIIIYLLNPIVTRLQQRGVPRSIGAILAYVVVLGSLTLIIVASIPFFSSQAKTFSEQLPRFKEQLVSFVESGGETLRDRFGLRVDTSQVSCLLGADETTDPEAPSERRCEEVTEEFRRRFAEQAGRITEIGVSVLEGLLVFILAPLLALYLLIDLPQLQRDILNLVPETHKDEFADLASKIGRAVGGFFRGQLLVALTVGILSALGFLIIGLPFWLLVGMIAGFFNLIPLVGPFVGGAVGFLVGTATSGVRLGLLAALVELIVQQIDNHVISPNIMKRTVQLHPVTVMLALLAGGTLAGFWGVLLGVPAVAVAKILLGHLWATRVLQVETSPHSRSDAPPSVVPEGPPEAPEPEADASEEAQPEPEVVPKKKSSRKKTTAKKT